MNKATSKLLENQAQMPDMVGVIRLYVHGNLEREYPLGAKPLVIGRSTECDVILPNSAISRRHAKVIAGDSVAVVKDLGSAHGIQVDGQAIQEYELRSRDQFSILQYQFKFTSAADYKMEQESQADHATATIGAFGPKSGDPVNSAGSVPPGDYYGAPGGVRPPIDGSTFLAEVLAVAREKWRLIAAFMVAALIGGLLHGFLAVPMFDTNAQVQVESKIREVGGPFLDFENSQRVSDALVDEVEVLRSRTVLGEAVDNLGLSIKASPSYFPFVGSAIARTRSGDDIVAEPLFGSSEFAWSSESIVVESMDIPSGYLRQQFKIIAGNNGTYEVVDADGNALARGRVGELLSGWLPSDEPSSLFISELRANRGVVFKLTKIPSMVAIENLRNALRITDGGISSSIIRLSLSGPEPEKIAKTVDEIITVYVQQTVERQTEEAVRTLQFVEQQIPRAMENMEAAEARLNDLRLQRGSVDLPSDTQVVLDKIVRLEAQVSELQWSRAQLIERFTPQHPRVRSLDAQLRNLQQNLAGAESQVVQLPTTQREVLSISREVAVASGLYLSLVNRAQELQVVSAYAATTGNARVVDYAILPLLPFRPNKQFLLVIYLMLGLLLSAGFILFQRELHNVVRDPELIEARLNLPIYATLTHSSHQETLGNQDPGSGTPLLAAASPTDSAIEGMRSLRTSLQFAFVNSHNNVLLITGPTARIGKTFISSNLAAVLAASGRSVVVIDADLRRGTLHGQFNLSREPGLADVIGGGIELDDVIHKTELEGLHVVSAGAIPPNPSELLMHERFVSQLQVLSTQFDHVIIDSPPVLAVTDPALISRLAGVVLLVVKSGTHPMREIEQSVKQLMRVGANLKGVVFNDMPLSSGNVYGYRSYVEYTRSPSTTR